MENQALVPLDLKVTRNTRLILYIYPYQQRRHVPTELQDAMLKRHSNVTRLNRPLQPSPPLHRGLQDTNTVRTYENQKELYNLYVI